MTCLKNVLFYSRNVKSGTIVPKVKQANRDKHPGAPGGILDTVLYFDDLLITHVDDRTFDGSYSHPLRHFKPDTFSLEMICSGAVDLKLDDTLLQLQSPAVICTGDSNRFYRFYYNRGEQTYRHIWIDFHGTRGRRIYSAFLKSFPHGQMTPTCGRAKEIQTLFEEIFRDFHSAEFDHPRAVVQLEQLVYLCLAGEHKNLSSRTDTFKLQLLTNRILANPFGEYSLPQLAAERSISQVYLRKLFQQHTGIPLHKFILKARMEMAAELLRSGSYRIGELAEMCRFSDISAFSRAFKRMYGTSPRNLAGHSE